MGFALPSGVVNTDSAYFEADMTLAFGPMAKQPTDQTLVVIDYSQLTPPILVQTFSFMVDVTSNPALVVSYPHVDVAGRLVFLVSGGIEGQQYNLSITINASTGMRVDVLTVNIPSSGDCDCETINPVPALYSQLPLGEPTQGYVNSAVRYFWGAAAPVAPNVMDQWYDPTSGTLYEWATDGTQYFWQVMMSASIITDAPFNNLIYGRYNGSWVPEPIQSGAPQDGNYYSRRNATWQLDPIQSDAPNDGAIYARQSLHWVHLPQQPILSDAPLDGNVYGRMNATWTVVPPLVIKVDAPLDGNAYMRSNAGWSSGGNLTGSLTVVGNTNVNGTLSVGTNLFVTGVATFGAQVTLAYDPISAMQAATKEYVDNSITNAFNVNGSPFLRLAGGTMAGPITLSADPAAPLQPVTLQYFNNHSAAGLTDAVADGTTYGRMNHTWVNVLPLTGGTLTGALILSGNPTVANGAANKAYVDSSITASVPQPSGSVPLMDGTAATGVASSYARADHVHPTDSSLYPRTNPSNYQTAAQVTASLANYYPTSNPAGYQTAAQVSASLAPYALISSVPVASTTTPLMNGAAVVGTGTTWARADHVHPTDTSLYPMSNPAGYQTAAQVAAVAGNYLPLTGGTLTGPLTLSADPTTPLGAATKQYIDNAVIDCGTY